MQMAKLSPAAGAKGTPVVFQFNPKSLKVSHNAKMRGAAAGGGSGETLLVSNLTDLGLPTLSLQDLRFDGPAAVQSCAQLLEWSYAASQPSSKESSLPQLIFSWGEFQLRGTGQIPVTVSKVDITYQRFDPTGKPSRAQVALDLEPSSPASPKQNPTSGGLPGRTGHVLISGETLPGIARGAYGDPADWRRLAEANQVDDPLRVRPGSVLYLPGSAELAEGGAT
jgi:nucleoid-associated protein YgaU